MDHGMIGLIDIMLAPVHQSAGNKEDDRHALSISTEEIRQIEAAGTRVITADYADSTHPSWHDPIRLRHAFAEVLKLQH